MSIKYSVIPKKNPRDPEAPAKYHSSVKSSGRKDLRQISRQISEISTVSSVGTMANIEALLTLIPRELVEGNIVQLGDFGSFRLRINSEGADTPEGVNAHNIKNILVTFTPD